MLLLKPSWQQRPPPSPSHPSPERLLLPHGSSPARASAAAQPQYEKSLLQASTAQPSRPCSRRVLPAAPSSRGALAVLPGRGLETGICSRGAGSYLWPYCPPRSLLKASLPLQQAPDQSARHITVPLTSLGLACAEGFVTGHQYLLSLDPGHQILSKLQSRDTDSQHYSTSPANSKPAAPTASLHV